MVVRHDRAELGQLLAAHPDHDVDVDTRYRTAGRPVPGVYVLVMAGVGPGLLEPWRDTVDEVVLVPVSAKASGPARYLVDAAIAAF